MFVTGLGRGPDCDSWADCAAGRLWVICMPKSLAALVEWDNLADRAAEGLPLNSMFAPRRRGSADFTHACTSMNRPDNETDLSLPSSPTQLSPCVRRARMLRAVKQA